MDISSSGATHSSTIRDSQKVHDMDLARRKVREGAQRQSGGDEAVISDRGQLLQRLGQAVRDSSDVREDKVAELRSAVEQGTYRPADVETAKAILASRTK